LGEILNESEARIQNNNLRKGCPINNSFLHKVTLLGFNLDYASKNGPCPKKMVACVPNFGASF